MRLYLDATSKHNIAYTPDTLIVELGRKHKVYDIQGWTDFDENGLHTRTKGELMKQVGNEFELMTDSDKRELANLLANPETNVIISIYPAFSDDENVKANVDFDELGQGTGLLCLNNFPEDINFKFYTEFYGL